MVYSRLLLKIIQGLKLIQGTVDLLLVLWEAILQKSCSKAIYVRQTTVSSQELSQGHVNTSLPLAHHHTCSQQGPSSAIPFPEGRRWLKKAANETANSMVLVFPLDLKQSKIGDLPESCGRHLCETFWRGNEESLPRDEVE